MNLMMLLEMAAGGYDDRVAIGDKTSGITYAQLFQLAGQGATWLRNQPAERLLYTNQSAPALPVALYASSWAGKPFVPVSYRLADDRLQALLARQAPATLLAGPKDEARLGPIGGIEYVDCDGFLPSLANQPMADTDWSMDGEDIAVLLHTSGTSGDPKVAVLRQRHLVSYVIGSVEFFGAEEDEATLVCVPPYHIAGMSAILTSVYAGRRIVQLPTFEPAEWVRLVREQEVTHAMVVPTMLARITEVLEDGKGLPSMRHLSYGGGRMPLPVIEKALELLPGVNFVNAYGLTETSSSIAVLGPDDHRAALGSDDESVRRRLGSVGRPLPTVEISIRDLDGNPLPTGEHGEVWVRGEQVSGEYSQKGAAGGEGWFATKDGGYFDEGGYLFVEGRIDDVIVRGGENLSPGEIEDVLLEHPAVTDAVVFGVPDTDWGEVVAASVVLHEGMTVEPEELVQWVTKHLRSSRAPAVVQIRSELPYNDTGKVLRRVLRDEFSKS